jgi:Protein of unknown function (DUF2939)
MLVLKAIRQAVGSTVTALALLVCGYTLSPMATAALLGHAVKSNNADLMNALVDWDGVKDSLRVSILARLEEKAQGRPAEAGLIDSVKFTLTDTLGPYMVDYVLNQRVSPAGFNLYMGSHSPMAEKVRAMGIDPDTLPSANTLKRIHHANFRDLTHFEIEIEDRWDPEKVLLAHFELRGWMWQLATVDMLSIGKGA